MIRARALWVLAQIARREDGDLRAARVDAYATIDPLIRGLVRGDVQKAAAAAAFETSESADERHQHRLAFLRLSGDLGGMPDDRAEIEARFTHRAPRSAPAARGPTWLVVAAVTLGGLCVVGAAAWLNRPAAPLREELPPSRGAWVSGGRPDPGSESVRLVFERGVPAFVAALDGLRAARDTPSQGEHLLRLEDAEASLIRDSEAALGPDTTSFLRALLDQSKQMIEDDGAVAADSHVRSVDALNAAIAGLGLGYYVDAEVLTETRSGRHRVYMSTFTVERVRIYRSGSTRVRALRLTRLDHLNFARSVLGFTRPQVSDGLVLRDRIEGYLVGVILPALGEGARMPLVDEESRGEVWAEQVETLAAADARAEVRASLGEPGGALGELFARRQRVLESWERRLSASGLRIIRPRTFDFDVEDFAALEARVPAEEMRELRTVAAACRDEDVRATYRAFEEVFIASVERHEVQHRLDYGSDALAAIPEELESMVGPLESDGVDNPLARRALAELSAYLSELARGPDIFKTNLALLLEHALNRRSWGTAECYAGLAVLEGLGAELGIGHSPLVVRRQIDRAALVDLYVAVRERDQSALVEAARALWRRLIGRPLETLVNEA